MELAVYSFITSMMVCFLLTPLLIRILHKQHVLDEGGRRKIHKGQIPSMGGIVIFLAFTFAMLAWIPPNDVFNRKFLFSAIILMFITGLRDDIIPLRPRYKLVAQILSAAIVVSLTDIRIVSFYGFLGINELPLWVSYTISAFTIIVITNAYNLIDGIDGLAGTVAVISFSFLAVWFYLVGNVEYTIIMFGMTGAVLGFLYYNWHKASIFMGDTGSMFIGFMLAISAIAFIKMNGDLVASDSIYHFSASISMAIAIVLFPLFDTLRVFIIRLSQGKSPFIADKQHIHHHLLRLGYTHAEATAIIGVIILVSIITLQFAARHTNDNILVPSLILLCIAVNLLIKQRILSIYRKR